jgi:phosphate transport system protein
VSVVAEARVEFHEQLRELEQEALSTTDLCITALDQAVEAVVNHDPELASIVVKGDDEIDARYLDVHQGILSLLARQSPVATDLRLVAALLHTISHIERIGDLCVNMSKLVPLMGEAPPNSLEIFSKVEQAALQARDQIKQAQIAFADRNLELAEDLVRQDDRIDQLNRDVFNAALEIGGEDASAREWAAHMMLIARYIERVPRSGRGLSLTPSRRVAAAEPAPPSVRFTKTSQVGHWTVTSATARRPTLASVRRDTENPRHDRRDMSANAMSWNGDDVREHEMRRIRREIRDRARRGHSHDQMAHWLATQESRITECELVLARLLVRHHAARTGSGSAAYLKDLGRTID